MSSNQQPEGSEQLSSTAPAAAGGPNGAPPAGDANAVNANAGVPTPPVPESRLPTRKDASLKQFLNKMDDYAPIVGLGIPDFPKPRC